MLVHSPCLQAKEKKINIISVSGVFVFLFLLFIFSLRLIPFAPYFVIFFPSSSYFLHILLGAAARCQPCSPQLHNFHMPLFKQSLNCTDEHRFVSSSNDNDTATGAISDNTIVTNDYVTKIWLRYSERLIIKDSEGDSSGLFNYMPAFSWKYWRTAQRDSPGLLIRLATSERR